MAVKQRLSVYLDADMMAHLEKLASKEHAAKSSIAEAAIISFLTADDADRWEAAVTRRLDRLTRSVDRVERELESLVEALALYVRAWLTARRLCRKAHKPRHRPRGDSDMRASLGLWDGG
jgi:predicted transcriptional regulator